MEFNLIKPIDENLSPLEQVFYNRDFIDQMEEYLHTTEDNIYSPFLLRNMDEAVQLLQKHLAGEGRIYVQVDPDLDGFASAAILLNYLHLCMPDVVEDRFYWGLHEGKIHGIDTTCIDIDSTVLVICPDSSSNEKDVHATLAALGIDVLVLDHHECPEESANAIIVNNQMDDYPNKTLCGAGIVWKFCQALDAYWSFDYADNFRDMTAWAIISDMMDLRNCETRRILDTGMENIQNPMLMAMINNAGPFFKYTPKDVAFSLTPYINAMVRMGSASEKELIFNAMLEWKAYERIPSTKRGHKPGDTEERVAQAVRTCTNVKSRQSRAQEAAISAVEQKIIESGALSHKVILVQLPGEPDPNLLGLNANKIMAKYQKPTMLLRKDGDNWVGSARNVSNSPFEDFRKFCEDSGLVNYSEGHAGAFGISIADKNIETFIKYSDEKLANINFSPAYKVDFIFSGNDCAPTTVISLAQYKKLWGQQFQEPKIAITNLPVYKGNCVLLSPDKKPTIKITLPNGIELIKFKASAEEYEELISSACTRINIVGTCDLNSWNNKITPQLVIEEYEIINKQEYYF